MTHGKKEAIIAFDVGDKRIGVAFCDAVLQIPLPVETYWRTGTKTDVPYLVSLAEKRGANRIVCGLPVNFDGSESVQTAKTARFIEALRAATDIPVTEVDERFTTLSAEDLLLEADMRREKRKEVVDKIAASYILENYLNTQKGETPMSEMHEKVNENEEELSDVVELVDDSGRVLKFYHIGTMDFEEDCYAFFQPAEEIEGTEEDEVIIFRIADDGKGGEVLLPVEDEKKLDAVYEEFCKMMEEDEECDGDCEGCDGCDETCDCGEEDCEVCNPDKD